MSTSSEDKNSAGGPSMDDISMETPEIPELLSSKDFAPSSFSQVVFPEISDYFPPGKDVSVSYVLTEALEPSSRDWVGLFQVGWTTAREYLTFVWAPKIGSKQQNDRTVSVTFTAYYLPMDKNEFYQFCYVTKQGHVRGASTPFQFREPSDCDHLIEVEDESGMIVLKTKTAAMQENLDKLTRQKFDLESKVIDLDNENTRMAEELEAVRSDLASVKERDVKKEEERCTLEAEVRRTKVELEEATAKLQTLEKTVTRQKSELTGAASGIAKLAKEALTLKEELLKMSEEHEKATSSLNCQLDEKMNKLTELESEVKDLTEKLKKSQLTTNDLQQKSDQEKEEVRKSTEVLMKERDDAVARTSQYREEKELFKDQFAHSEEARQGIMQQLSVLKDKLLVKDAEVQEKADKILVYEEKTKMLKNELKNAEKQIVVQKSAYEGQLSNMEDKLNACEASKRLISNELTEARDRRDKLMSELHQVKKEKDQVTRDMMASKRQLSELEKNYLDIKEQAKRGEQRLAEKDFKLADEKIFSKEKEKELLLQIEILKSQLESADMAVATAASSSETEKSETSTQTMTTIKEKGMKNEVPTDSVAKDSTISDMKLQIEDLRTRLSMGAAAYTEKYMECHKLERKMKKLQNQKTLPKAAMPAPNELLRDSTTSDSQDDSKMKTKSESKELRKVEQQEEQEHLTTGGNFMAKLEQLFMAIADPDVEEQEHSKQLKLRMQELEKSLQFQHAKYKKYKQLYLEEKVSHTTDYEKSREEAIALKSELHDLKNGKELLEHENKALKEQLKEFVKNSRDENIARTLDVTGIPETAPPGDAVISRYGNPYKTESTGTSAPNKYPHETLYPNGDDVVALRDSSESDLSDEFHLASARFAGLGLCPKNQSSDDSDPIEISRPPLDVTPPGDTVIKRQPTRSPPLIEVISEGSEGSPTTHSGQDRVKSARTKMVTSSSEKAAGPRRRRGTKLKKARAKSSYA